MAILWDVLVLMDKIEDAQSRYRESRLTTYRARRAHTWPAWRSLTDSNLGKPEVRALLVST
jgi:hypothetical protein